MKIRGTQRTQLKNMRPDLFREISDLGEDSDEERKPNRQKQYIIARHVHIPLY